MPSVHTTPTLADVAKAAGVSTATVSRCLNQPAQVSKPTLDRVMEAVDTLGYTPNFGARVMAARRTYTIGAIIPTMDNAIFARGLQAFQEELHAHGYTLLVSSCGYRPEVEQEQIKALVARGADGLLLIGYERAPAISTYLQSRNIPALVTWAHRKDDPRLSIGFDNRRAMQALARAVLDQGHKRIGVISAVIEGNDRAAERLAGIREALDEAGIDPATLRLIETPYGIQNGAAAMEKLMQSPQPPTAVMCGNDVLAVGALRRAQEIGLSVPGDVSITGFDDIELAQIVSPGLTTVHVPHREMGRKAALALIGMVEDKETGMAQALDTTLKMRGSLGPVSG